MYRKTIPIVLALILLSVVVVPVGAITGGQPDGNGHPYSALVLVPEYGFCSGTLIAEKVVLTAGHCTSFFDSLPAGVDVWVTFDSVAAVDPNTWGILPGQGNWYIVESWVTHPGYSDAAWPFTPDYGLVFLEDAVVGIAPAPLAVEGYVDELVGTTGQTKERFYDVGYGQNGVTIGGGPYYPNFDWTRKVAEQPYSPSKGSVGSQDPTWLTLINVPSGNFGAGCGGDSGSGVFTDDGIVVAVHTGGYRLGYKGYLCGRITSLNHRVDVPGVRDWIASYLD